MILLLAICSVVSINAKAGGDDQRSITTLDTLTDGADDTTIVTITGGKSAITFQTNVTKISGTVGGQIILEGTIDTSETPIWVHIESDTLTDATGVYTVQLTANHFKKYRLRRNTVGATQSASYKSYLLYRD